VVQFRCHGVTVKRMQLSSKNFDGDGIIKFQDIDLGKVSMS